MLEHGWLLGLVCSKPIEISMGVIISSVKSQDRFVMSGHPSRLDFPQK
jgi:hypothetical protein